MARIPAVCANGHIIASGFEHGGGSQASFTNCSAGPCPTCGLEAVIPDGLYKATDDGIFALLSSHVDPAYCHLPETR